MLAAVGALHRACVVHGDLAPRNILVDASDPVPVTSTSPRALCMRLLLSLLVLEHPPKHELRVSMITIAVHCKRMTQTADQKACRRLSQIV